MELHGFFEPILYSTYIRPLNLIYNANKLKGTIHEREHMILSTFQH